MFKKARDLETHLQCVHSVSGRYYSSYDQLTRVSGDRFSLVCGDCSKLIPASEAEQHVCRTSRVFRCHQCGCSNNSREELEQHLVNMVCGSFTLSEEHISDGQREREVLHQVLTGRKFDQNKVFEQVDLLQELRRIEQVEIVVSRPVIKHSSAQSNKRKIGFSCSDRNVLTKYGSVEGNSMPGSSTTGVILEDIPCCGVVYCGHKSRGINNHVKKEFKDLGRDLSLVDAVDDQTEIHEDIKKLKLEIAGKNIILSSTFTDEEPGVEEVFDDVEPVQQVVQPLRVSKRMAGDLVSEPFIRDTVREHKPVKRTESKMERIANLQQLINQGLSELRMLVEEHTDCLFCQQCRTVWVEATFLLTHMIQVHQADPNHQERIIEAIKKYHKETRGKEVMFRFVESSDFVLDEYSCSYCLHVTCDSYSELFDHVSACHGAKVLTCAVCQNMFLNYGSLISHVCSGPPTATTARARFACKMCLKMDLSSFLEFQLHIRSQHHTCEICFQPQSDQRSLHAHCSQHEQDLMCMKCFVTFERVESFRKHLHAKHAAESVACGQCWAPTWPHVYHFCLPELAVTCPVCETTCSNTAAYRVHQRTHTGATPHVCSVCNKGFISKSLLWKHMTRRHPDQSEVARLRLRERRLRRDTVKFGAGDQESVETCYDVVDEIVEQVFSVIENKQLEMERAAKEAAEEQAAQEQNDEPEVVNDAEDDPAEEGVSSPPAAECALDAAIRSIMPSEPATAPAPPTPTTAADVVPHQTDREAVHSSLAGRTYTEDNSWQAGLDALLAGAATSPINTSHSPSSTKSHLSPSPGNKSDQPVIGGLWNQDLMFIGGQESPGGVTPVRHRSGPKIRAPHSSSSAGAAGLKTLGPDESTESVNTVSSADTGAGAVMTTTQWDLDLSEESDDEVGPREKRTPGLKARTVLAPRPLLDHDYCYHAYLMSQQPAQPPPDTQTDLSEMDKILSNVAFGGNFGDNLDSSREKVDKENRKKKKKKKKKKRKREAQVSRPHTSSDTDSGNEAADLFGINSRQSNTPGVHGKHKPRKLTDRLVMRGPKPVYHTPDAAKTKGVMAGTARPSFDTDSSGHGLSDDDDDATKDEAVTENISETEISSSDYDTDFSAEDLPVQQQQQQVRSATKARVKSPSKSPKPALKLKIKLPPQPDRLRPSTPATAPASVSLNKSGKKRRRSSIGDSDISKPVSKKIRDNQTLNTVKNSNIRFANIRQNSLNLPSTKPAAPTENAKLYCICRAPHDEVSDHDHRCMFLVALEIL